ncbi:MAG: Glycosyltransferase [Parcubacteria bacterium C7867-004]|nr:MAG: Glycosyltransferase [Parcubacteria bacterium C7867-004]
MTKVLFVSNDPALFIEGSAVRTRMQRYAHEIGELFIVSRAPESCVIEEGPLMIKGVKTTKLGVVSALARAARSIILERGIEIVSAQDPFEYGLAALNATKGTAAKLHIQVHTDLWSPWFIHGGNALSAQVRMPLLNRVRRIIADRVLPHADGIRTVSNRVRESLIVRYDSRIPSPSVIPIEVDSKLPDAVPLPPHDFTFALITVSRLEPEKRIEDLIFAIARVSMRYPSVGLFIVGEGSMRTRLERMVHRLNLGNRVVFLGARTDARGLMRSCQAYIQASGYEGYGLTLVEAALSRIPIITTDVGIVGEVFKGFEEVLVAPPGDPAALATHIMGLVEDMDCRSQLIMSAEHAAKEHLAQNMDQPKAIALDLARLLEKKG